MSRVHVWEEWYESAATYGHSSGAAVAVSTFSPSSDQREHDRIGLVVLLASMRPGVGCTVQPGWDRGRDDGWE